MNTLPLFQRAMECPQAIAIRDENGQHLYGQLVEAARTIASNIRAGQADLEEDRVAFLVPPSFSYVAVQWGIWAAGGIAVPLGLKHPLPEIEYVLNDARVSRIIVAEEFRDRVAPLAAAHKLQVDTVEDLFVESSDSQSPALESTRRAMILYTSGSTGKPKGVVTTHGNILAQIDALVSAWEWTDQDRILHVLPMHHIHGIINVLGCALRTGASCDFLAFDPMTVWERLARRNLSLFMAVPTIYTRLIQAYEAADRETKKRWSEGASTLRLMVSGSAALPVPVLERWEQITGQRLLERYGMTEIGMALSNPLHGERRAGHVGAPLPKVEVSRADENGDSVEDDQPGEILVRGPAVFQEYWNKPEATAESFRDGWFRTGDIAVVDEHCYRILGRSSVDIIKTGGYKVSALEIEDVLRSHDEIRDCAVVGIPDDEWGERVAVAVVPLSSGSNITLEQLRTWAKERLASYKVPSRLLRMDELPRNAMGKVQKPIVKEQFQTS